MTHKLSTETTPREEWSYILLVLKELLTMAVEKAVEKLSFKKMAKKT
jgi:hypothetical protein